MSTNRTPEEQEDLERRIREAQEHTKSILGEDLSGLFADPTPLMEALAAENELMREMVGSDSIEVIYKDGTSETLQLFAPKPDPA